MFLTLYSTWSRSTNSIVATERLIVVSDYVTLLKILHRQTFEPGFTVENTWRLGHHVLHAEFVSQNRAQVQTFQFPVTVLCQIDTWEMSPLFRIEMVKAESR